MSTATATKRDVYQDVTDRMLAALEEGTVPWQKPWSVRPPTSMASNKPYRGINLLLLGLVGAEYGSQHWGTYKKITELGGQVRKGEKSTMVTFWKKIRVDATDSTGAKIVKDGKVVKKDIMLLKSFNVFNADQADWADGMPAKFTATKGCDFEPIEMADEIVMGYLKGANAPYYEIGGDRACYSPFNDTIMVPAPSSFTSSEASYKTTFHEMAHSTGHETRLARPGVVNIQGFGTHTYGQEELVAEMTAAFLAATAGLEGVDENSAAYLASWIRTIKEDPKMLVKAAGQAQKAADLILGVTPAQEASEA